LAYIKSTFFLVIPILLYGIDPSISSLKKVKGFESSYFSSETGFQYLKIKYQDTSTERPKLGFLKFGLAFIKVKDLKVFLDLRHANAKLLIKKWEELLLKKAIKYATLEPITISLVQPSGNIISVEANKGKFSSIGQLKLWGEVVYKYDGLEERLSQVVISFNNITNELEIMKGTDNGPKLRVSLKESGTEKGLKNN
jgi:hypothetical protein